MDPRLEASTSWADLCEMAAHRDPRLAELSQTASQGGLRIAACYERAVRGLFRQAGCPLPTEGVEVLNMRELAAEPLAERMMEG